MTSFDMCRWAQLYWSFFVVISRKKFIIFVDKYHLNTTVATTLHTNIWYPIHLKILILYNILLDESSICQLYFEERFKQINVMFLQGAI